MTTQNEMMIAGVRRQKDAISDLVCQLESRPGLREEDVQYADSTLKNIENNLKRIRKTLK